MITITNILPNVKAALDRSRFGLRAPKGGCTVGGKVFKGGQFCLPYDPTNPHGEPTPAPIKLAIAGFAYTVRPIPIDASIGSDAFEVSKDGWAGNSYHVHHDVHGEVRCTCPDFEWRRQGIGQPCKHGKALVEAGLIKPPVATLPPFRHRFTAPASTPATRPARPRRFEPSADECREAAALLNA